MHVMCVTRNRRPKYIVRRYCQTFWAFPQDSCNPQQIIEYKRIPVYFKATFCKHDTFARALVYKLPYRRARAKAKGILHTTRARTRPIS